METLERLRLGYSASNTSQRLQSGKELRINPISFGQVRARFKTNIECLTRILGWNRVHNIQLFRISTHFITKPHEFDYKRLLTEFGVELHGIKAMCEDYSMRLTLHGITQSMGSPDAKMQERAYKHLEYCSDVLDAIGSDDSVIVQHLGGAYKQRFATRERVVKFIKGLPENMRRRIVLENDDKWSVADVTHVARNAKCGFVYDVFHHKCFPQDIPFTTQNVDSALRAVRNTCAKIGKTPKVHISSQNPLKDLGGHSDLIDFRDYTKLRRAINLTSLRNIDIMVEADLHEQAVLALLSRLSVRKPIWSFTREGINY